MTTINSTFTEAESREVEGWCAEVRAAHALISSPIEVDDPRYAELVEARGSHVADFTPDDRGHLYFSVSKGGLPSWPLPAPAWATTTKILGGIYPEMQVLFLGNMWPAGAYSAQVEQLLTIFVDDFNHNDGTVEERGSNQSTVPRVFIDNSPEQMGWEDALSLAAAVEGAASELRDFERPQ